MGKLCSAFSEFKIPSREQEPLVSLNQEENQLVYS